MCVLQSMTEDEKTISEIYVQGIENLWMDLRNLSITWTEFRFHAPSNASEPIAKCSPSNLTFTIGTRTIISTAQWLRH